MEKIGHFFRLCVWSNVQNTWLEPKLLRYMVHDRYVRIDAGRVRTIETLRRISSGSSWGVPLQRVSGWTTGANWLDRKILQACFSLCVLYWSFLTASLSGILCFTWYCFSQTIWPQFAKMSFCWFTDPHNGQFFSDSIGGPRFFLVEMMRYP